MATKTEKFLVPLDVYLKSGVQISPKFRTKLMSQFIYKIRSDSLSILNIQKINERLEIVSDFISKFAPEEIFVVCKRRSATIAIQAFSELTGIKISLGRYLPGSLTNPNYEEYIEPKLVIVCDPWQDRNVIRDAYKRNIPVVSLCDASNVYQKVDLVIPCNNKSNKSVGLIFYILAREYLKKRKIIKKEEDMKIPLKDFQEA